MKHPIVIPRLGATGGDVRIVEWLVKENQNVAEGDILFMLETDKAVTEVEAFRSGRVQGPLANTETMRAPGDVVGYLTEAAGAAIEDQPQPLADAASGPSPDVIPDIGESPRLQPKTARFVARVAARTNDPRHAAIADELIKAFSAMVLIRRYEEYLYKLFLEGLVPGTLHQCQGQEAVAVGVCSALRRDDVIYSTHRPVGHLLAKGASLDAITAEIWGKATGCVGGKGGQMHLADFSVGAMVSNAIVGANIPIATGSAMAFRLLGLDRVAVSFFGDGASNIGAFHEGLNLAAVKKAPVVFICENNLYAASTLVSLTMNITDIADRAAAYGMPGEVVDGMDVEAVYRATSAAVLRARRGDGPTLIECKTYRYRGHSRGDPGGYRERAELEMWKGRDPIVRLRQRLIANFGIAADRLAAIEVEAQTRVEAAVATAMAAPEPNPESALEHVYAN